jgi:NADH-quinone oxidoreductase subunit I/electron transport complex protein RnfC
MTIIEVPRGKVLTIERNRAKGIIGQGLLKGMRVIFDHWRKSWTDSFHSKVPENDKLYYLNDMDKVAGVFTVEYPEVRIKLPEASRNMPILLYDDATGHELCTSCFQCQRICPPQVIHMTQAKDPNTGKAVPSVSEFIIEYDACMSCGFCAEVCPFDAIKMDHFFELSTADHASMTVHKTDLLRPVSYYESIAPSFWAEVKESAYKKLGGNMKRRPGVIGIAPQMVETIKATRPDLIQEPAPAPAAKAKPAAKKPAAEEGDEKPMSKEEKLAAIRAKKRAAKDGGGEAETPAADEKPMSKEEKLAAIRAKKRAEKAQAEGAAPEAPPPAPAEDKPMSKEERLAAIRAKKRAEKAQAEGAAPEEATPAGDGSDGKEQAATGANMPDDKKARLEAIRAAKRKAKEEGNE